MPGNKSFYYTQRRKMYEKYLSLMISFLNTFIAIIEIARYVKIKCELTQICLVPSLPRSVLGSYFGLGRPGRSGQWEEIFFFEKYSIHAYRAGKQVT